MIHYFNLMAGSILDWFVKSVGYNRVIFDRDGMEIFIWIDKAGHIYKAQTCDLSWSSF